MGEDKAIGIWDLENKKLIRAIENAHEDKILCMALSRDEKLFITGSWDRSIKVWSTSTFEQLMHIENAHHESIWGVDITQDNAIIASGSDDNTVRLFNAKENGKCIADFDKMHTNWVGGLYFSADDKHLFSVAYDSSLAIVDVEKRQHIASLTNLHVAEGRAMFKSNDDSLIATVGYDKLIRIIKNPITLEI